MSVIQVMASGAFKSAYLELAPQFERSSGHRAVTSWVPTVKMMSRLRSGEVVDLVIMSDASLRELAKAGVLADEQRCPLVSSVIGVAVQAGAPRPGIGSADAVKRAVLAASSIVYSTGPSGVYLAALFERMGIAGAIRSKTRQVQGEPAGALVARGEAELGFQQVSELLPVPGIDLVGPLPAEIQETTLFSAGVPMRASEPDAARAMISYFRSAAVADVIRRHGLEPAAS